jgi:hypothetical protein
MKLSAVHASTAIERVLAFLRKAPDDEVYTSKELMVASKTTKPTLYDNLGKLSGFSLLTHRRRYWGNKKAIAELRRLHETR